MPSIPRILTTIGVVKLNSLCNQHNIIQLRSAVLFSKAIPIGLYS